MKSAADGCTHSSTLQRLLDGHFASCHHSTHKLRATSAASAATTACVTHPRFSCCSMATTAALNRCPSSLSVRAVVMHCEVAWPIDSRIRFMESVTNWTPCAVGAGLLNAKAALFVACKLLPELLPAAACKAEASCPTTEPNASA